MSYSSIFYSSVFNRASDAEAVTALRELRYQHPRSERYKTVAKRANLAGHMAVADYNTRMQQFHEANDKLRESWPEGAARGLNEPPLDRHA